MLNRKVLTLITAAGLVGFGAISSNAFAANGTGDASATILAPLRVVQDVAMDFGDISPDETDTSIVRLDLVGGRTNQGTANAGLLGTAVSAQFTVFGAGNLNIAVSFAAGTLSCSTPLTCTGAPDLTVSNFTHNAATALTAGQETFEVGADLGVDANQLPGDYDGTYTVTVNYN